MAKRRISWILIGMLVGLATGVAQDQVPSDSIVRLDQNGRKGLVFFDHQEHQSLVNPDPDYKFKTEKSAPCSGCHHTKSVSGVIQLWSCRSCHGYDLAGSKPPTMRAKMYADEAFHSNCLGCHRATKKGPTLCGGCHKTGVTQ